VRLGNDACWEHLRGAGHGVLSTTNARGTIDAVPVCFAVAGKLIATPIDRVKPKDTFELGRLKNLDKENRATLLCDHWKRHDWSELWWVRAHLVRRSGHDVSQKVRSDCEEALREKYEQYRGTDFDEVIVFEVKTLVGWSATGDGPASDDVVLASPAVVEREAPPVSADPPWSDRPAPPSWPPPPRPPTSWVPTGQDETY
jgi:PPOX class probable F420-dependent enzyme